MSIHKSYTLTEQDIPQAIMDRDELHHGTGGEWQQCNIGGSNERSNIRRDGPGVFSLDWMTE